MLEEWVRGGYERVMGSEAVKASSSASPVECPAPVSMRQEAKLAAPIALAVLGAMMPATVVIPVIRSFVSSGWPESDWVVHAFMAVNLLGACLVGPLFAVRADRLGNRGTIAGALALLDGVSVALVASKPPLAVMLGLRFIQGAASVGAVSILMGSARSRARSSFGTGLVGSAVILALVVGIPLGAILGRSDPSLPLIVGGTIGALAGFLAFRVVPAGGSSSMSALDVWRSVGIRRPVFVVGLERFSVGSITVTLQLFAHNVLQVPDHTVGRWLTIFLVAFALCTLPLTRVGDRVERRRVIALGAVVYAAMFFSFLVADTRTFPLVLAIGGIASAAIYGPSLSLVSQSVPSEARASAMGLLNAAGTLGMFLGNVAAAAITVLLQAGAERGFVYSIVFVVAGLSQLLGAVLAATSPPPPAAP